MRGGRDTLVVRIKRCDGTRVSRSCTKLTAHVTATAASAAATTTGRWADGQWTPRLSEPAWAREGV